MDRIRFALPKGRLLPDCLDLLEARGIALDRSAFETRKLEVDSKHGDFQFLMLKPIDVPVYVEYGAADVGIVGADILLELNSDVHDPLDLEIGRCQVVVAGRPELRDADLTSLATLRVATKYPRITERYFRERGIQVEIVPVSGSVEVAPRAGLSDRIVDLVQTGVTLRENGLVILADIMTVTARFIVNRAAYHVKADAVSDLIARLRADG